MERRSSRWSGLRIVLQLSGRAALRLRGEAEQCGVVLRTGNIGIAELQILRQQWVASWAHIAFSAIFHASMVQGARHIAPASLLCPQEQHLGSNTGWRTRNTPVPDDIVARWAGSAGPRKRSVSRHFTSQESNVEYSTRNGRHQSYTTRTQAHATTRSPHTTTTTYPETSSPDAGDDANKPMKST